MKLRISGYKKDIDKRASLVERSYQKLQDNEAFLKIGCFCEPGRRFKVGGKNWLPLDLVLRIESNIFDSIRIKFKSNRIESIFDLI